MFKKKSVKVTLTSCSVILCILSLSLAQEVNLTSKEINEDLDQFQRAFEEQGAYFKVNNPDYKGAIQKIRDESINGMEVNEFGRELMKVIALFVDCHSQVQTVSFPPGYLPFHIEYLNRRYLAIKCDRSGFVADDYPYITKIDGISFDKWMKITGKYVAKGSPQLVISCSLWFLINIQYFRNEMGVDSNCDLTIELQSKDLSTTKVVTLETLQEFPPFRKWPEKQSGIIEENIGYLRLTNWNQRAFDKVKNWMSKIKNTNGLIIDVRDNNGGTRSVLRDLYPYFAIDTDKPVVANIVKYRLFHEYGPDHLDSRNIYKKSWAGWTKDERQEIHKFMKTFEPEWNPPEDEFSEWHFWVLSKNTNPEAYDYTKPVIFLMNEKGFSATDVILAAVKEIPNITLLGMPSGGGSGAAMGKRLDNSKLLFVLSSMASFQKDGSLIDSRGVQPDICLEPVAEYYLNNGPDVVLEKAKQLICDSNDLR
jgi:hypothetical protein